MKYLLPTLLMSSSALATTPINQQVVEVMSQALTLNQAQISPDGKHLAIGLNHREATIGVMKLKDMSIVGHTGLSGNLEMGDFFWANNKRLVSQVMQKPGWSARPLNYGEFYAFDYDGKRGKMIYGARAGDLQTGSRLKKVQSTLGWGALVDRLNHDERFILLSSTPWSKDGARLPELIKVDVNTGVEKGFGRKAPIASAQFTLTQDKMPLLATGLDEQGNKASYYFNQDGNTWNKLDLDYDFTPILATNNDQDVYGLAHHASDKKGLYTLNIATQKLSPLFVDERYDIDRVIFSTDKSHVVAVRIASPLPEYILLDNSHPEAGILKMLISTFPGQQVEMFNKTSDGKKALVWVGSDQSDGALYLYDIEKNTLRYLYAFRDGLKTLKLTATHPVRFTASDGLEIEGYFTEAKPATTAKSDKMVVLVHGGPHGIRDAWNFDPEVHLLAQHGYNVLRVNFRGSGGRGEDFVKLGYEKWGTDIQRDIYEGVQWAIKEQGISKDKVCIMGGSFGGYSAVMSPIRYPNAYQCGIANVGVYYLPMMFEEGDIPSWYAGKVLLSEMLGTDGEALIDNSPVRHVDKLTIPLFLAHGEKDERAPIEHYEMLTKALDKAGKPYESFVVENEAHGFYDAEVRAKYYTRVLEFLAKHLDD